MRVALTPVRVSEFAQLARTGIAADALDSFMDFTGQGSASVTTQFSDADLDDAVAERVRTNLLIDHRSGHRSSG